MFDVVIVGGGPAGAATGLVAAGHGLKTLILEKAIFPRDKVCGDALTPSAIDWLSKHKLNDVLQGACLAPRFSFHGSGDFALERPWPRYGRDQPPSGAVISRRILDERLLSAASQGGADVRYGAHVVRLDRAQADHVKVIFLLNNIGPVVVESRIVVLAAGARAAKLAPSANAKFKHIAFRAEVPIGKDVLRHLNFYFQSNLGQGVPGYSWAFPMEEGTRLNIGYGLFNYAERAYQHSRATFAAISLEIADRLDLRFDVNKINAKGWVIPTNLTPPIGMHRRILLVGDSAGLADPATGEGIGPALISGGYAGEAIWDFFRHKSLAELNDSFSTKVWSRHGLGSPTKRKASAFLWKSGLFNGVDRIANSVHSFGKD